MWKAHPDNNRPDAWTDLRRSLDVALAYTEPYGLFLGVEPETANVINTVDKAARLLREVNSPRLRIVFDPANLFEQEDIVVVRDRIEQGLDLLGDAIISAHAKDRNRAGDVVAAGQGVLPYDTYLRGLKRIDYRGGLMLHGLLPADVPDAVQFLTRQWQENA